MVSFEVVVEISADIGISPSKITYTLLLVDDRKPDLFSHKGVSMAT